MDYQEIIPKAKSKQRPAIAYENMPDDVFFPYKIWWGLVEVFVFLVCSARAGKVPENETEMEELIKLSGNLSEQFLSRIGPEIKDEKFFQILCDLGFEQRYLQAEMMKRTEKRQLPLWVHVGPNFGGLEKADLKWKTLSEIKVSQFAKRRRRDLMNELHDGYEKATDIIRDAVLQNELRPVCPPFPVALDKPERNFWQKFEEAWDPAEVGKVIQAMSLNDDAVQKKVWNKQQQAARKEKSQGKIKAILADEIRAATRPKRRTDQDIDFAAITMNEIVNKARKQIGPKAALAFRFMAQGLTDKVIAKHLEITSRTIRNYRTTIKKIVTKK
jgi:hypothetical protein